MNIKKYFFVIKVNYFAIKQINGESCIIFKGLNNVIPEKFNLKNIFRR